ncbi:hypothetical protein [Leuconostoc citreum]
MFILALITLVFVLFKINTKK